MILRLIEARPYDQPRLPRRADLRQIAQVFAAAGSHVVIDARGPADFMAFRQAVAAGAEVLHFDGHAGHDESGVSCLAFENRRTGQRDAVSLETVLEHIEQLRPLHRVLLCLSACGRLSDDERRRIEASPAVAAVVGFDGAVHPDDAGHFFAALYRELAQASSIGAAFRVADGAHRRGRSQAPGSKRSLAEAVLVTGAAAWQLFQQVLPTSVPISILRDNVVQVDAADLHPTLRRQHETASALHTRLVAATSQRTTVVTGQHGTGRSTLAKYVALRVAWAFKFVLSYEVDPRLPPLTDLDLALELVKRCSGATREVSLDGNPIDRLRAELSTTHERGLLILIEVDEQEQLTAQAWDLIREVQAPSAVVVVGSNSLRRLGCTTFELLPLDVDDARSFFFAHVRAGQDARDLARAWFSAIYAHCGGYLPDLRAAATSITTTDDVRRLASLGPVANASWSGARLTALRSQPSDFNAMRLLALFMGSVPQTLAPTIAGRTARELDRLVEKGALHPSELVVQASPREVVDAYAIHAALRRALLDVRIAPGEELDAFERSGEDWGPEGVLEELTYLGPLPDSAWQVVWRQSVMGWANGLRRDEVATLRCENRLESAIELVRGAFTTEIRLLESRWSHAMAATLLDQLSAFYGLCGLEEEEAMTALRAARGLLRGGELAEAKVRAAHLASGKRRPRAFRALASVILADVLRLQGSPDARGVYARALTLAGADEPTTFAEASRGVAELERESGHFADAISHLEGAFAILAGPASTDGAARSLRAACSERLGYIGQILRRNRMALRWYDQARLLAAPRSEQRIRIEIGVADVLANDGRIADAERTYSNAEREAHAIGNVELAIEAGIRRARARARGATRVREALVVVRALLDSAGARVSYRRLTNEIAYAEVAIRADDPEEATRFLDFAVRNGFYERAGPSGEPTMKRAKALVRERAALIRKWPHESLAADELLEVSKDFAAAASAFRDLGYAWRANRCDIQVAASLVRAGCASKDGAYHRQAIEVASAAAASFAEMGDRLREGYARGQLSLAWSGLDNAPRAEAERAARSALHAQLAGDE